MTSEAIVIEDIQPTTPDLGELHYAGFWQRFGAFWLDIIIFLPITGLSYWLNERYRLAYVYSFVPWIIVGLWYYVYLVKRYGGTPGKRILKIRITRLDGTPVGYREAFLRHSVLFVLSILQPIAILIAILNMSDAEYLSLGFQERTLKLVAMAPAWHETLNILSNIWIWSEFVVMLTNKRRRAPHDFIAGTVVIRDTRPRARE
jgi:uncharacterized RDD family membrane protein YckC